MRTNNQDIDMTLSVLCVVTKGRGQTLTCKDIAEICGCSMAYLYNVEQRALKKLASNKNRHVLAEYLVETA